MATRKLGFQPLLAAVYTRLTTDALTSGYTTYNFVPRAATMPFISFGAPIGTRCLPFTTKDTEAEENVITVHAWSAAEGDKQASEYMDNIVQAILGSSLSVTGYNAPFKAFLDMAEIFVDDSVPTRLVRHGVLRFHFWMSPS